MLYNIISIYHIYGYIYIYYIYIYIYIYIHFLSYDFSISSIKLARIGYEPLVPLFNY